MSFRFLFLRGDRLRCSHGGEELRTHARTSPVERYLTTSVRRADLFPKLTASGRVESAKRTIIECDLENVAVGVRGQRLDAGGAAVLLSVVPEGTTVKRGDVLAVIDSSDYEELLRIQEIAVERAAADHVQASSTSRSPSWRSASSRKGPCTRRSRTSRGGSCWLDPTWNVPGTGSRGRAG